MSQSQPQQKNSPIVSKGSIAFNGANKLEMTMKYPDGTRTVTINQEFVRKIAEIIVTKTGQVYAHVVDTTLSIDKKTEIALPMVNESEVATRIISADLLTQNNKTFPLIGYAGVMSDMAIKVASALAEIAAPIGGGYFSGRALLVDSQSWVGGLDIPAHFKNMRVVRRKNQPDTVIFSVGKTIQEMSVANVLKQLWKTAKPVNPLNENVLFIGRPSVAEGKVYVVTTKNVLNLDFTTYKVETVKDQPASAAEMATAFFKEGDKHISLTKSGSSLTITNKAA